MYTYTYFCKQITEQWKTVCDATLETVLNPIDTNGKCLTKIQPNGLSSLSYLVMAEETPTSGTDFEDNTEDELTTDISNWSDKECKKLQHMTEFHREYQRDFGNRALFVPLLEREFYI